MASRKPVALYKNITPDQWNKLFESKPQDKKLRNLLRRGKEAKCGTTFQPASYRYVPESKDDDDNEQIYQ